MSTKTVAIVSETKKLKAAELERVAAALQKQVTEHFEPAWGIAARIKPAARLDRVPDSQWPVIIRDKLDQPGGWSFHDVKNGRPYAMVTYGDVWSQGASHDLLEMLTDPYVKRIVSAPPIQAGKSRNVQYLVQICDPCAATSYDVDGVRVADFTLPDYWANDPSKSGKYSYTGGITKPFEILRGGYLSWRDPSTNHWWQQVWWNEQPEFRDLGSYNSGSEAAPAESEEAAPARVRIEAVHFKLSVLRDVYLSQAPHLGSARATVERLIQQFGGEG